jgi:hypothetical protein
VKLYHGTTEAIARQALKEGLKPRGVTGVETNWKHSVESNPSTVYLTDTFAPYFSMNAAEAGDRWAIVEVETRRLEQDKLVPDEDYLEQATRGAMADPTDRLFGPLNDCKTMEERTRWFRDHLWVFAGDSNWKSSLDGLGTCGYMGSIPKKAVTGIALFDPAEEPSIGWYVIDARVGIVNKAISGKGMQAITQWMMGYDVDPADLCGWKMAEIIPQLEQAASPDFTDPDDFLIHEAAMPEGFRDLFAHMRKMYDGWDRVVRQRRGLEVIRAS